MCEQLWGRVVRSAQGRLRNLCGPPGLPESDIADFGVGNGLKPLERVGSGAKSGGKRLGHGSVLLWNEATRPASRQEQIHGIIE